MKNNKGLSFVELLIAITIGIILVGFAALSMATVSRNSVNRVSDKIFTACNTARNNTVTKGSKNSYLNFYYKDGYLYTNHGLDITAAGTNANLATQNWEKVGKVDSVSLNSVPLYDGKVCTIRFKQSTGELDGFRFPYASAGYQDWQDNSNIIGTDFRITAKIGSKEKSVRINKFGSISKN